MGYASYEFEDGFGLRGYAVEDTCHHPDCSEPIDRGLAYVCYSCTKYFCGAHLVMAWAPNGNDLIEFDCFAGQSSQCCHECAAEAEEEAAKELEATT